MTQPRPTRLLREHVAAAKQLLQELDVRATAITAAIGRDAGANVLASIEERGRVLDQLVSVTQSLAQTGVWNGGAGHPEFNEILGAATSALESQDRLSRRTGAQRDRLADAMGRPARPDPIAACYHATADSGRRILSVAV